MNDLAPSRGQMFNFFSVNRCSKASKHFRCDSNSYAFVIVVANACYNSNTIWTYFFMCYYSFVFFSISWSRHSFFICSIIPFLYKKEKDQCGCRSCSEGGQPGYILINGEFVAIHASIMRLNETWSVAKSLQLWFKNALDWHVRTASPDQVLLLSLLLLLCFGFVYVCMSSHCRLGFSLFQINLTFNYILGLLS